MNQVSAHNFINTFNIIQGSPPCYDVHKISTFQLTSVLSQALFANISAFSKNKQIQKIAQTQKESEVSLKELMQEGEGEFWQKQKVPYVACQQKNGKQLQEEGCSTSKGTEEDKSIESEEQIIAQQQDYLLNFYTPKNASLCESQQFQTLEISCPKMEMGVREIERKRESLKLRMVEDWSKTSKKKVEKGDERREVRMLFR